MTNKKRKKPPIVRTEEETAFINQARVTPVHTPANTPTPQTKSEPERIIKHYSAYLDEEVMDQLQILAFQWRKQSKGKKLTNTAILRAVLDALLPTIENLEGVESEEHLVNLLSAQIKK